MELVFSEKDGVNLIQIIGRLDASNYIEASAMLNEKLDKGIRIIIFDLSKLEYVSSSGLRVFLGVLKRLKLVEGDLILCDIQPKINEVFQISGFNSLFKIAKNLDEAFNKIDIGK